MSISTYAELQTAVGNWLNRSDLSAYIPDFIMFGENRIYRELRLRCMETSLSGTTSSGVLTIPTDYLELKHSEVVVNSVYYPLERITAEEIYQSFPKRSSDSRPYYISTDSGNFIFGPFPDTDYTISGTYYKRLTALSNVNTTNWFTSYAPDLLLVASLVAAEPYLQNDERVGLWEAMFQDLKTSLMNQETREKRSGSPLRMRVR